MSLIECNNCGTKISSKAIKCPNCGKDKPFNLREISNCPECDVEILLTESVCPKCGYPNPFGNLDNKDKNENENEKTHKRTKLPKLVIWIGKFSCLAIALFFSYKVTAYLTKDSGFHFLTILIFYIYFLLFNKILAIFFLEKKERKTKQAFLFLNIIILIFISFLLSNHPEKLSNKEMIGIICSANTYADSYKSKLEDMYVNNLLEISEGNVIEIEYSKNINLCPKVSINRESMKIGEEEGFWKLGSKSLSLTDKGNKYFKKANLLFDSYKFSEDYELIVKTEFKIIVNKIIETERMAFFYPIWVKYVEDRDPPSDQYFVKFEWSYSGNFPDEIKNLFVFKETIGKAIATIPVKEKEARIIYWIDQPPGELGGITVE